MSAQRQGLALFGGTFNPPHNGHIAALETVCRELNPGRILVAPTGRPVHKKLPEGTPEPCHRMAMAALAFQDWPGVEITDHDLNASGYAADTLDWLTEVNRAAPIWLVVGADMFLSIQSWRDPERIFAAARIAVLSRENNQESEVYRHAEFLMHRFDAAVDILPHKPVEVSSTHLRHLLGRGLGEEWIPQAVLSYIRANGLYTD